MKQADKKRRPQQGFSLIELLIVVVIIGILVAIAVPVLSSSRRAANGASALESLRVITAAQSSYQAGIGNQNYGNPDDLYKNEFIDAALAGACSPDVTSTTISNLPPPIMSTIGKSGYRFIFQVSDPSLTEKIYNVTAVPVQTTGVNRSGDRTFFLDQTGVIRVSQTADQMADVASQPLN
ncbi:MAG: prepilin-type N-terminal cleavage/methylation domain-containing protein [Blastocatellia bacterium]|nr:prepilin-type N-terminal cleavage/methylation domain-containing protein [Blastocatellia bacterium]